MCGVEGEAPLLTSFHCLFFLKLGQLKLVTLMEGDRSGFSFLSLNTNWYWVYKTSHYQYFLRRSAFPGLYGPKVFQLAGFRFHLHNQIKGKHFSFSELLFCGSVLNWNNSRFFFLSHWLSQPGHYHQYPDWQEMEKFWITLLCCHCNCQLGTFFFIFHSGSWFTWQKQSFCSGV